MENDNKKNQPTEEVTVIIVDGLEENLTEEELSRCGTPDVAHMDIVPSKKINEHGNNGDAIIIPDAAEMDKKGKNPQHVTKNGVKKVISTKTTQQQLEEEAAEKKRIAEMPSPSDNNSRSEDGER